MIPGSKFFKNHPRREETDYYIARYDGEIHSIDSQIQRLIENLESRGILDDALVIITADHGEGLGEHNYYFEHGWFIYQHQIHVPLLIRFPGQKKKRVIQTPAALSDLAPTILDILGISIPPAFHGRSLLPLIKGLIIIVLGGMGSLPGAFVAGMLLGLIDGLVPILFGHAWAAIGPMLMVIIVLVIKPQGLFGHAD